MRVPFRLHRRLSSVSSFIVKINYTSDLFCFNYHTLSSLFALLNGIQRVESLRFRLSHTIRTFHYATGPEVFSGDRLFQDVRLPLFFSLPRLVRLLWIVWCMSRENIFTLFVCAARLKQENFCSLRRFLVCSFFFTTFLSDISKVCFACRYALP